ncbi:extracellular solute-binding protein [Actinomadura macrotermitis]|uniref:Extracellular solute-binding protein n=1 Tax=Actinomadura macrotermitis TaxID=2585200 RepID=A0A7K0BP36_9ACTN|nr:extracellular solute-binding protein [Actinomadura macrotermitis]MQY02959.1 hypothetical protein [Actinomadura macrotermitis]
MRLRALAVGTAIGTVLALGACSGGDEPAGTAAKAATTVGSGEGALNLVALPGHVENGGSDPRIDWITPFEERTGCKVNWRTPRDAGEAAALMSDRSRRYDGVSAPPEIAARLITGGQVAPVNPGLVDGYKRLEPRLRNLLKRADEFYGVPYLWGTDLLMYDTGAVQPAPHSWAALFDPAQAARYSGRLVVRDSPLVIADAALYLKAKDRKLRITDPFSLTPRQLDAVAKVLERQRPHVQRYWKQPAEGVGAFAGSGAVLGGATPYQADVLGRAGRPVQSAVPDEGVTGWMNAWMIGSRAEHPNCMYQWLRWTISPEVQQQAAEWNGAAPADPQVCARDTGRPAFCGAYRIGDRAYLDKVVFVHAPAKECGTGTGGGKRNCTDYTEWTRAWIKATKLAR